MWCVSGRCVECVRCVDTGECGLIVGYNAVYVKQDDSLVCLLGDGVSTRLFHRVEDIALSLAFFI